MPIIVMTGPDTFKVAQYGENPADPIVRISPEEYQEGLSSGRFYDPPRKPGEQPAPKTEWRPTTQTEWRPTAQSATQPVAQPVARTAPTTVKSGASEPYAVYTNLADRPVPPAPYFSADVDKTGVKTTTTPPKKLYVPYSWQEDEIPVDVPLPGTKWYASKDELPPAKKPQTYFLDVDMRPTEQGMYPSAPAFNLATGLPYERESEPTYVSRLRQPIKMAGTQWHPSKDELPPSKKKGALDVDLRPSELIYVEVQGVPINPATGLPLERVEEPTYTERLVQPIEMAGTQWYASKDETMPVRPEHGVKWPEGRRTQTVALVADPVPTAPFGPEFPETIYSGTPWIMPGTEWHPSKDELPPRYRLNVDLRPSEQMYPEPVQFNPATGLPYEWETPSYTSRLRDLYALDVDLRPSEATYPTVVRGGGEWRGQFRPELGEVGPLFYSGETPTRAYLEPDPRPDAPMRKPDFRSPDVVMPTYLEPDPRPNVPGFGEFAPAPQVPNYSAMSRPELPPEPGVDFGPIPTELVNPVTGLPYQREVLEKLGWVDATSETSAPRYSGPPVTTRQHTPLYPENTMAFTGGPEGLPQRREYPLDVDLRPTEQIYPDQPPFNPVTGLPYEQAESTYTSRLFYPDETSRFLGDELYFPLMTSYTAKPVIRGTSSKQEHAKAQRRGMYYDPETRTWKPEVPTNELSPTYDSYSPWWQYYFATHEPFIVP